MKKIFLLGAIAVLACSCGGGGGDDGGDFLGGVYTGAMGLFDNTCGGNPSPNLAVDWTVNQDNSDIVLTASPSGENFTGHVSGDAQFTCVRRFTQDNCIMDVQIIVTQITGDSAQGITSWVTQCGIARCETGYNGPLHRELR